MEIIYVSLVVYLERKNSHIFNKKERSMGELIDITIDKKETVTLGIHNFCQLKRLHSFSQGRKVKKKEPDDLRSSRSTLLKAK